MTRHKPPESPAITPVAQRAARVGNRAGGADGGEFGGNQADRPLAIDLFTGLHGWSEGLIAEGFRVVGYDIEDMSAQFGQEKPEHFELVIQDVLTLHGAQFKDAALIVASPPCQEYSYMAMPWSLAKAKAAAIRADTTGQALADLNRLFNACFRIQAEASLAAGRHIPMVIENVCGAQPWVGRARYNFGSFYLWGDVPALMPMAVKATKNTGGSWFNIAHNTTSGCANNPVSIPACQSGVKSPGKSLNPGSAKFNDRKANFPDMAGIKQGGDWFNASSPSMSRLYGSKSPQRKMAKAMIAKIPVVSQFEFKGAR